MRFILIIILMVPGLYSQEFNPDDTVMVQIIYNNNYKLKQYGHGLYEEYPTFENIRYENIIRRLNYLEIIQHTDGREVRYIYHWTIINYIDIRKMNYIGYGLTRDMFQ